MATPTDAAMRALASDTQHMAPHWPELCRTVAMLDITEETKPLVSWFARYAMANKSFRLLRATIIFATRVPSDDIRYLQLKNDILAIAHYLVQQQSLTSADVSRKKRGLFSIAPTFKTRGYAASIVWDILPVDRLKTDAALRELAIPSLYLTRTNESAFDNSKTVWRLTTIRLADNVIGSLPLTSWTCGLSLLWEAHCKDPDELMQWVTLHILGHREQFFHEDATVECFLHFLMEYDRLTNSPTTMPLMDEPGVAFLYAVGSDIIQRNKYDLQEVIQKFSLHLENSWLILHLDSILRRNTSLSSDQIQALEPIENMGIEFIVVTRLELFKTKVLDSEPQLMDKFRLFAADRIQAYVQYADRSQGDSLEEQKVVDANSLDYVQESQSAVDRNIAVHDYQNLPSRHLEDLVAINTSGAVRNRSNNHDTNHPESEEGVLTTAQK